MSDRIRALRERQGLTQQALADRAGLTRQLVGAMEAKRHSPNVAAAIAVARALGVSVEELFRDDPTLTAPIDTAPADGAPVRVGRVGDLVVVDHGRACRGTEERWSLSDGVWSAGEVDLFPGAEPAELVIAGCDPMIGPLAEFVERRGPHRVLTVHASTRRATEALENGRAHAAIVHGPRGSLDPGSLPVRRWHLARWQAGLAGAGRDAPSLDELVGRHSRVIQRESGAATQAALDRALARAGADGSLPGPVGAGHLDVARRVRSREGRAGVTMEAAAVALELRFVALEEHEVEIWIDRRWIEEPAVTALIETLTGDTFARRAATVPGYDVSGAGTELGQVG